MVPASTGSNSCSSGAGDLAAAAACTPKNNKAGNGGGGARPVIRLSLRDLQPHFAKPMKQVTRELGIGTTAFKKQCRNLGIPRWPHRRIRSIEAKITALLDAMRDAPSVELSREIARLRSHREQIIVDPAKIYKSKLPIGAAVAAADVPSDETDTSDDMSPDEEFFDVHDDEHPIQRRYATPDPIQVRRNLLREQPAGVVTPAAASPACDLPAVPLPFDRPLHRPPDELNATPPTAARATSTATPPPLMEPTLPHVADRYYLQLLDRHALHVSATDWASPLSASVSPTTPKGVQTCTTAVTNTPLVKLDLIG